MQFTKRFFAALFLCALIYSPSYALTIKLGSVAPDGSPWDIALKKIAAEWSRISGGTVRIKIYPGGIVGDEPDMIRKMRIGQLHAAIFTGVGMSYISPEVLSLHLPYLVRNDNELDYLMKRTTPSFNKLVLKKGFKVVAWSKVGWAYIFSKRPVYTPADLKRMKLAVSEGEPKLIQSWRQAGFNVVPLSTNDTMTGLQSGLIEAFYCPPLVAAAFQWFGLAPYMNSLKMAPMLGGLVVHKSTWDKIPAKYHAEMIRSTERIVRDLYRDTLVLEQKAFRTMKQHGLKIVDTPPDKVRLWKQEAQKGYNIFIGKTFSKDLYRKLVRILEEYRRNR